MLYSISIMRELLLIDAGNTTDCQHCSECFGISDKSRSVKIIFYVVVSSYHIIGKGVTVLDTSLYMETQRFSEIILEFLKSLGCHQHDTIMSISPRTTEIVSSPAYINVNLISSHIKANLSLIL